MLSAIIRTKNSESTIYETLESIKDFSEIIIIDEHSTDDTVDIAKEYRAKIIYASQNELLPSLNQALYEAKNDWIIILQDDEIMPQELLNAVFNYIQRPKKKKNSIYLSQKTFYLNKELKCARKNKILRLFKKGACKFKDNYSTQICKVEGRSFRIKNNYILRYLKSDVLSDFRDVIDDTMQTLKLTKRNKSSLFLKPLFCFLKIFLFRGGIFNGRIGYIYSVKSAMKEFLIECARYERIVKNDI